MASTLTFHQVLTWLLHHHLSAGNIRLAMVALVHQVQHWHPRHATIWLTHIRGAKPGAIMALQVKLGPGVLSAHWR